MRVNYYKFFKFILPLIVLGILPWKAYSQTSKLNSNTITLSQQNVSGFYENKGQINQTNGNVASFVSHVLQRGNTNIFILRNGGIAYQFQQFHIPNGYKDMVNGTSTSKEHFHNLKMLQEEIRLETYRMDMVLEGANPLAEIISEGRSTDYNHYYNRNALFVHHYQKITYKNIYQGIDWVIYCRTGGGIKYDFVVHPGADPAQIKLRFNHHEELYIDDSGNLIHSNKMGRFVEKSPVSFQNNKQITTSYVLEGNLLTFSLGTYDKTKLITIDPDREWATYYGGMGGESSTSVTTDKFGNIYMAGVALLSDTDIADGGHQNMPRSARDAFLVKFNSSGVRQWATYYGGSKDEVGTSCITDQFGNVYLAGSTESTDNIAISGHQNGYGGGMYDGYLVKFNSQGVRQWATYYGGDDFDLAYACVSDSKGSIYVIGGSKSTGGIASSGHQNNRGGDMDAYIVKFDSLGTRLWGTYYGGSLYDFGRSCAIDSFDNLYVAGVTSSTSDISSGGHQMSLGGGSDAFLVKFNSNGVRQWATYYGGTNTDQGLTCATDISGSIYLAGYTQSTSGISSGGHQNVHAGNDDGFLVKFNSNGVRQWGTYYGGSGLDIINSSSTDALGNLYLVGRTGSATDIAFDGHQNALGGGIDAFIVKFGPTGVRLWGTYYGGNGYDGGEGCAIDGFGNLYVSGSTSSINNISYNGHQDTLSGGSGATFFSDAFLVKFKANLNASCITDLGKTVINVNSLPYKDSARSICGSGNYLNNTNTIGCGSYNDDEEVFVFSPSTSDTFDISTYSTNSYHTLALYKGCPLVGEGGECVASNTASSSFKRMRVGLESGETYYLIVSKRLLACADYSIEIALPPSCDSYLTKAINIPQLPFKDENRNICSSGNLLNNANAIGCGSFNHEEEIFTFIPTSSDSLDISTYSTNNEHTLALFKGCPLLGQGGECIAFNTNSSSYKRLRVSLDSGETYYLVVSKDLLACANYSIEIGPAPNCDTYLTKAINIPQLPFKDENRNICSSGNLLNNANTIGCGSFNHEEEIFTFIATSSDSIDISTYSTNNEHTLALFKGCPLLGQGGECIAFNTNSNSFKRLRVALDSGETYYLVVSKKLLVCADYSIEIAPSPTCEDYLTKAIDIPSLPYLATDRKTCNEGSILNDAISPSCAPLNAQEEIYKFTANSNDSLIVRLMSNSSTVSLSLYEGCPLLGKEGDCIFSLWNAGESPQFIVPVDSLKEYYLVVSNSGSLNNCINNYSIGIGMKGPGLSFVDDGNFSGVSGVSPASGYAQEIEPNSIFEFQVVYSHTNNVPPKIGYPVLGIDVNNDGVIDELHSMYELDSEDSDFSDGKIYVFERGFNIGSDVQYAFFAYDSLGNVGDGLPLGLHKGPEVYSSLMDLYVYANSIRFSKNNPQVGDSVKIEVSVHNQSEYAINDVLVNLYLDTVLIGQDRVSIAAKRSNTIQIYQMFNQSGFYPVRVEVDPDNELKELNRLNNKAIRPILIGDLALPGTIEIELNETVGYRCQEGNYRVKGYAYYSGVFADSMPVAGAEVLVKSSDNGIVYKAITKDNGTFNVFIPLMSETDSVTLVTEITDFTIWSSKVNCRVFTKECKPFIFTSRGSSGTPWDGNEIEIVVSGTGGPRSTPNYKTELRVFSHFIAPESINPDLNEKISIVTSVENSGKIPADSFYIHFSQNGDPVGNPVFVQRLTHGQHTAVLATDSVAFTSPGYYTVEVSVDPENRVIENNKANNFATRSIIAGPVFDVAFLDFNGIELSDTAVDIGQNISIKLGVNLIGNAAVSGELHIGFKAENDTQWFDNTSINLTTGDTIYQTFQYQVVETPGEIVAVIKNLNNPDVNESNNYISQRIYKAECKRNGLDPCNGETSITYQGHTYSLVPIGNQCWFGENLQNSYYANGDPIDYVENVEVWYNAGLNDIGAWCYYANDTAYGAIFGKLYNGPAAADPRNLCPDNWHIPSESDFLTLLSTVEPGAEDGRSSTAANAIKIMGQEFWSGNSGAHNSSQFSALGGGERWRNNDFRNVKIFGHFWSSTIGSFGSQYEMSMGAGSGFISVGQESKTSGKSCRCVRNSDFSTEVALIKDEIKPTAVGKDVTVYLDSKGEYRITSQEVDNGSTDDCEISEMQVSPNLFNCVDVGVNEVDFIVFDGAGNVDTAKVNVTVLDTIQRLSGLPAVISTPEYSITTHTVTDMPNATYIWMVNGGTILSDSGNVCTVQWTDDSLSSIQVVVINEQGCKDSLFASVNHKTNGLTIANHREMKINLYPNPAKDKLNIQVLNNQDISIARVDVSDFAGKLVLSQVTQTIDAQNHTYGLDIQSLSPGVYVLTVVDKVGNRKQLKFTKNH